MSGYLLAFFAITMHESAHCAVALIAGADDLTLLLMPYGATLIGKGEFPHFGAVLIAGPLANVVLASFSLSLCWIFPELYGYFKGFISLNIHLAALNLLPAYPLDGGRLVRLLFSGKWARVATLVASALVAAGALLIFAFTLRVTYLIFALFMLLSLGSVFIGRRNRRDGGEPIYSLAKLDEEGRVRPASIRFGRKGRIRLTSEQVTALLLAYPPNTAISDALVERGYK